MALTESLETDLRLMAKDLPVDTSNIDVNDLADFMKLTLDSPSNLNLETNNKDIHNYGNSKDRLTNNKTPSHCVQYPPSSSNGYDETARNKYAGHIQERRHKTRQETITDSNRNVKVQPFSQEEELLNDITSVIGDCRDENVENRKINGLDPNNNNNAIECERKLSCERVFEGVAELDEASMPSLPDVYSKEVSQDGHRSMLSLDFDSNPMLSADMVEDENHSLHERGKPGRPPSQRPAKPSKLPNLLPKGVPVPKAALEQAASVYKNSCGRLPDSSPQINGLCGHEVPKVERTYPVRLIQGVNGPVIQVVSSTPITLANQNTDHTTINTTMRSRHESSSYAASSPYMQSSDTKSPESAITFINSPSPGLSSVQTDGPTMRNSSPHIPWQHIPVDAANLPQSVANQSEYSVLNASHLHQIVRANQEKILSPSQSSGMSLKSGQQACRLQVHTSDLPNSNPNPKFSTECQNTDYRNRFPDGSHFNQNFNDFNPENFESLPYSASSMLKQNNPVQPFCKTPTQSPSNLPINLPSERKTNQIARWIESNKYQQPCLDEGTTDPSDVSLRALPVPHARLPPDLPLEKLVTAISGFQQESDLTQHRMNNPTEVFQQQSSAIVYHKSPPPYPSTKPSALPTGSNDVPVTSSLTRDIKIETIKKYLDQPPSAISLENKELMNHFQGNDFPSVDSDEILSLLLAREEGYQLDSKTHQLLSREFGDSKKSNEVSKSFDISQYITPSILHSLEKQKQEKLTSFDDQKCNEILSWLNCEGNHFESGLPSLPFDKNEVSSAFPNQQSNTPSIQTTNVVTNVASQQNNIASRHSTPVSNQQINTMAYQQTHISSDQRFNIESPQQNNIASNQHKPLKRKPPQPSMRSNTVVDVTGGLPGFSSDIPENGLIVQNVTSQNYPEPNMTAANSSKHNIIQQTRIPNVDLNAGMFYQNSSKPQQIQGHLIQSNYLPNQCDLQKGNFQQSSSQPSTNGMINQTGLSGSIHNHALQVQPAQREIHVSQLQLAQQQQLVNVSALQGVPEALAATDLTQITSLKQQQDKQNFSPNSNPIPNLYVLPNGSIVQLITDNSKASSSHLISPNLPSTTLNQISHLPIQTTDPRAHHPSHTLSSTTFERTSQNPKQVPLQASFDNIPQDLTQALPQQTFNSSRNHPIQASDEGTFHPPVSAVSDDYKFKVPSSDVRLAQAARLQENKTANTKLTSLQSCMSLGPSSDVSMQSEHSRGQQSMLMSNTSDMSMSLTDPSDINNISQENFLSKPNSSTDHTNISYIFQKPLQQPETHRQQIITQRVSLQQHALPSLPQKLPDVYCSNSDSLGRKPHVMSTQPQVLQEVPSSNAEEIPLAQWRKYLEQDDENVTYPQPRKNILPNNFLYSNEPNELKLPRNIQSSAGPGMVALDPPVWPANNQPQVLNQQDLGLNNFEPNGMNFQLERFLQEDSLEFPVKLQSRGPSTSKVSSQVNKSQQPQDVSEGRQMRDEVRDPIKQEVRGVKGQPPVDVSGQGDETVDLTGDSMGSSLGGSHFEPDSDGETLLHWLCDMHMTPEERERLPALPGFTGAINVCNNNQETALFVAVRHGHVGIVKFLLTHGADPNIVCSSSSEKSILRTSTLHQTALHEAVETGEEEVVRVLLNLDKTKVDFPRPGSGLTPLMVALQVHAKKSRERIVFMLIERGCSLTATDKFHGKSPLMLAIQSRDADLVTRILQLVGAEMSRDLVTHRAKRGLTCLHLAAELRGGERVKRQMLKTVIHAGGDPYAKNEDGDTAKDWAKADMEQVLKDLSRL